MTTCTAQSPKFRQRRHKLPYYDLKGCTLAVPGLDDRLSLNYG